MGPARIHVGVEFLLDGRAYRVVRQPDNDRCIARDSNFHVEEEFTTLQILSLYSEGRLRFGTDQARAESLLLPVHADLTPSEIDHVLDSLFSFAIG